MWVTDNSRDSASRVMRGDSHQRNRKQRATEQVEERQARLAWNREANWQRRQAGRQPEPEQMPKCQTYLSVIVAVAANHPYLMIRWLCVSCCSRDKQEPNFIKLQTTWNQPPALQVYSAANNMDPGSALEGLKNMVYTSFLLGVKLMHYTLGTE